MKIVYLTTSGQVGGAERCLLSLIHGLDRNRFDAHVVIGSPGPLSGMLEAAGVAHSMVSLPAGMRRLSRYHRNRGWQAKLAPMIEAPGYLGRLRRHVAELRPDVIHSNGVKMHYLSALLQRRWRAPVIWHLHDFPGGQRGLGCLAPRAAAAAANSEAVAAVYRQQMPRLAPRIRVIPNGVASDALAGGDRAGFRRQWGLAPEAVVIGMIAIFAPWKGQEVFLRAAAQVHAVLPQAQFLLCGDDIYDTSGHGGRRQELEALARDLGLMEAVRFTGFLDRELPSAYAALDVMVHASTNPEPFGRTAIEAMAAGVPVIAAAAGGMLEVVEDGVSGRLTPPGDAAALAGAMRELGGDTGLRQRFAAAGRMRVEERFCERVVDRQWAALYEELAS